MRIAFTSLLLAAGLASASYAQDPAPAAAPGAAQGTAGQPSGPSAAAAPAAEAAAAPPTLPTSGDGAAIINILEKVCVPSVRGQSVDALAKANGFKLNKRDNVWVAPLGGDKAYTVTVYPSGSNKDVCRGEVRYALNGTDTLTNAFNTWAFLHQPELVMTANWEKVYADGLKRVQRSWENQGVNGASTAVNFTTISNPDGSPVNPHYATAEFFYQERPGS